MRVKDGEPLVWNDSQKTWERFYLPVRATSPEDCAGIQEEHLSSAERYRGKDPYLVRRHDPKNDVWDRQRTCRGVRPLSDFDGRSPYGEDYDGQHLRAM